MAWHCQRHPAACIRTQAVRIAAKLFQNYWYQMFINVLATCIDRARAAKGSRASCLQGLLLSCNVTSGFLSCQSGVDCETSSADRREDTVARQFTA